MNLGTVIDTFPEVKVLVERYGVAKLNTYEYKTKPLSGEKYGAWI